MKNPGGRRYTSSRTVTLPHYTALVRQSVCNLLVKYIPLVGVDPCMVCVRAWTIFHPWSFAKVSLGSGSNTVAFIWHEASLYDFRVRGENEVAEHHTLEAVSKSQPLKHNGERALTPAVHCQIRRAVST